MIHSCKTSDHKSIKDFEKENWQKLFNYNKKKTYKPNNYTAYRFLYFIQT